ncbi:MAG: FAD-dependent oxidoreductase [Cyanobacteria bacterium P01_B01_bin.77]
MNPFPQNWQTPDISRRSALKLLGVGAIGGTLGYTRFSKPQPTLHQVDQLDLPQTVARPTTAVVIGGGLAGLAAAYELSKRGVKVTLLERSPQLGGKIASWPIQVGEHELRMEHGFHGFFPQYYNLFSLVDELQVQDNFQSLNFYAVLYKNGYKPEAFYPSNAAFPWNIVDLAVSSDNRLSWGINLTNLKHLEVFREITSFRMPQTYERLDHLSVDEWGQGQFPQGLYDLYFLPFAKSSLNAPDVLSAGELMQFFHFYFFGNPEGLAFNGTCEDMGRCLVDPLSQAIEANGGRILTGVTVSQVNWGKDKIASVDYQKGTIAANPVPFWCDRNPLLSTDTTDYYGAGDRLFVVEANSDRAISLTCTHQGCSVNKEVAANGNGFVCPCHGAAYDAQGTLVSGPAQDNLAQFKVLQRDLDNSDLTARIQLIAASPVKNTDNLAGNLDADYFVFAADIPGIKNLFALSQGTPSPTVLAQVSELQVADPFAVGRFWLDRDFEWEQSWFTSLSGYDLTDSITLYHKVQGDYIKWAAETGGSVVELHAYCYKEKQFPTQQALLDTFKQELWQIVPELEGANILHQELVNQKNFAGFPPGSYPNRPSSATAVSNLMFAGDWVKMPFPCGLMERAISSGLLAANEILHREGSARRPLMSVNPEGVFKV